MIISPLSNLRVRCLYRGLTMTILLGALLFLATGCSTSQMSHDEEYLLLCYNHEFGQRFSLPQGKAVNLSEGLWAIGFGQSKRTGMRLYLYLDSSLDIYSPKECGDFCDHNGYHSFLDFNEKDQDFHMNHVLNQSNRILLQSKSLNHGKDGYISSARHAFITKDTLKGLTLVSVHGFISQVFECEYGPIEILLQKNNTGDTIFLPDGPVDEKRVYRFDIPDKLTKQIMKYLKEDALIPGNNLIEVHYL